MNKQIYKKELINEAFYYLKKIEDLLDKIDERLCGDDEGLDYLG